MEANWVLEGINDTTKEIGGLTPRLQLQQCNARR